MADPEDRGDSLGLVADAKTAVAERMDDIDIDAMQMVLLLYRVTNAIVYDLESSVHRPAGWSWSAFRLCFTLWVDGPLELRAAARRTGMSKPAVTSLANTLERQGILQRSGVEGDARGRRIGLTDHGARKLVEVFHEHNLRERKWASAFTKEELATGTALLRKLVETGQQPWVSTR